VIVGIIRQKPVLTYASIIFGDMLASVNSVKKLHGLGRFRYMTVSVQRGGQFRYMPTSVHMRSILVRVFCSTTSVHVKYHIGTSLCRVQYIARERLSFYAEGLQMLNACLVCYVKLLMCN